MKRYTCSWIGDFFVAILVAVVSLTHLVSDFFFVYMKINDLSILYPAAFPAFLTLE